MDRREWDNYGCDDQSGEESAYAKNSYRDNRKEFAPSTRKNDRYNEDDDEMHSLPSRRNWSDERIQNGANMKDHQYRNERSDSDSDNSYYLGRQKEKRPRQLRTETDNNLDRFRSKRGGRFKRFQKYSSSDSEQERQRDVPRRNESSKKLQKKRSSWSRPTWHSRERSDIITAYNDGSTNGHRRKISNSGTLSSYDSYRQRNRGKMDNFRWYKNYDDATHSRRNSSNYDEYELDSYTPTNSSSSSLRYRKPPTMNDVRRLAQELGMVETRSFSDSDSEWENDSFNNENRQDADSDKTSVNELNKGRKCWSRQCTSKTFHSHFVAFSSAQDR